MIPELSALQHLQVSIDLINSLRSLDIDGALDPWWDSAVLAHLDVIIEHLERAEDRIMGGEAW